MVGFRDGGLDLLVVHSFYLRLRSLERGRCIALVSNYGNRRPATK